MSVRGNNFRTTRGSQRAIRWSSGWTTDLSFEPLPAPDGREEIDRKSPTRLMPFRDAEQLGGATVQN